MSGSACATAHPNIALAKYWGKAAAAANLPSVPSLSLTLDSMSTTTRVDFSRKLDNDRLVVNGSTASEVEARRVSMLLDRVRTAAGVSERAYVETANDFPTASGLASSASGFAALALAATAAAGLRWDAAKVSDLARRSSASAARSVFGGFTTLAAGAAGAGFLAAEPLDEATDWNVAMSVVVTTLERKGVTSSEGMTHTQATSPYYAAWVQRATALFHRARRAVLARDLPSLGAATEESAFAMHACALAAVPPVIYFSPVTLAVIARTRHLRREGVAAYVTMDAGPHVKVLSSASDAADVSAALRQVAGVLRVLVVRPGGPAAVTAARSVS